MLYMKVYFMLVHTFCMPIIVFKIKWICFFLFDFDLHLQRDPCTNTSCLSGSVCETPLMGTVVANFFPLKNNTKKKRTQFGNVCLKNHFLKKKKKKCESFALWWVSDWMFYLISEVQTKKSVNVFKCYFMEFRGSSVFWNSIQLTSLEMCAWRGTHVELAQGALHVCKHGCSPLLWGRSRWGLSGGEGCFSTNGSTHTITRHCTDQTQTFKSMQNKTQKARWCTHLSRGWGITPSRRRLPGRVCRVLSPARGFFSLIVTELLGWVSGVYVLAPSIHTGTVSGGKSSSWGRVSKTTLQGLSSQREKRTFQILRWLVGRTPESTCRVGGGRLGGAGVVTACCLFDSTAVSFQEQLKGPPEPAWAQEVGGGGAANNLIEATQNFPQASPSNLHSLGVFPLVLRFFGDWDLPCVPFGTALLITP